MSRLALFGGKPVTTKQLGGYNTIGEDEKREVLEVLESGVLSGFIASGGGHFLGGPKVRKLEAAWAERFQVGHAVAMNSASSALLAAASACDIGPGDEVVVAPLTMCATGAAVLANNATPVFADVDPRTMNMDPDSVAARITERTRAIFVVHLAGHPCDMDPLMALARSHGLFVLEDNAQAPGALYKGRLAGCIGHVGVFSLNRHKTIQCGEGGVAVTNDPDLALKLQLVRNHAEKCAKDFGLGEKFLRLGYNFRMTELEAAVAIHQLRKLDWLNEWRQRLAGHLTRRLKEECPWITPPHVAKDCTHVYYLYHMNYDASLAGAPLDLYAEAVRAEGILLHSRWGAPIYQLPIYQRRQAFGKGACPFDPPWNSGEATYGPGTCPAAEASEGTSLFLETLVRWPQTEEDMDLVVEAFKKVKENAAELLARTESDKEN